MTAPINTTSAAPAAWRDLTTEQRRLAVTTLRDLGNDKHEIAEALDTTTAALQGFCFRHHIRGVLARVISRGAWYDLDTEQKTALVRQHEAEGLKTGEIAKALGIKIDALRMFVWQQGLSSVSDRTFVRKPAPPMIPAEEVDPIHWQRVFGEPRPFGSEGCAWPIDTAEGQMCCGAERMVTERPGAQRGTVSRRRSSYCAHHHGVAYRGGAQVDERTIAWLAKLDEAGSKNLVVEQAADAPASGKKIWSSEDGDE